MSVMDAMDDLLTALDGLQITVNKVAPKRDPDLRWHDIEETKHSIYPNGWLLTVGFTVDREPGDAPSVWVHRAILQTGKRDIELQLNEIAVNEIEAELADIVDLEDRMEADALANSYDDEADGRADWLRGL